MFRLEYLKLKNHPQLGNLELYLSEINEVGNLNKPYTSIIIGANGTGKSFILRTIAEIFRQFQTYSISEKRVLSLPYDIHCKYRLNSNTYEIISSLSPVEKNNIRRNYTYFKNRPSGTNYAYSPPLSVTESEYEIVLSEVEFPAKLMVNSLMLTDRFVFQNSKPDDFYQYLGIRSTSGSTSTRSSSKKTIKHLFNSFSGKNDFSNSLKDLLKFLDFEEVFKINYATKINKLFFSGNLTRKDFIQYFEFWWDEEFKYSTRKMDNPLWSIPYYNNNLKGNEVKIDEIIEYLNELSTSKKLSDKKNSSSKTFSIDLFNINTSNYDLGMISTLEALDIVNLDGIVLNKKKSNLTIGSLSSGEYHLIVSLISIFANITDNSLILIDEPEISLHPNWQMKYITFLKKVFLNFPTCQFIITTHSHFLVSDLEGDSSSISALSRLEGIEEKIKATLLTGTNTFGWSAEEVLLEVFQTPTTRNYYVSDLVGEILNLMADPKSANLEIRDKIQRLKDLNLSNLSSNDPMKDIVENLIEKIN